MHILLLILKIIGWILLILLGLVVLIVCLVLFTPLRYQVRAACDGELSSLSARADFSLFFHVVRGSVRYIGQQLSWEVYLAWKRIGSEPEPEKVKEKAITAERTAESEEAKEEPATAGQTAVNEETPAAGKPVVEEKPAVEEKPVVVEKPAVEEKPVVIEKSAVGEKTSIEVKTAAAEEPPAVQVKKEQATERTQKQEKQKKEKQKKQKQQKQKKQKQQKQKKQAKKSSAKEEKEPLGSKLTAIVEKIKCTCREICDKIKELLRKKDILMEFLTNDSHRAAWNKLLAEVKKLLRRLLPKKFQADIRFGFEDPSVTGRILAGISMVYPMICEHAEICPDFTQKILKGNVLLKGHVRVAPFAAMLWNMLLNSHVRRTVMDIKNFKF